MPSSPPVDQAVDLGAFRANLVEHVGGPVSLSGRMTCLGLGLLSAFRPHPLHGFAPVSLSSARAVIAFASINVPCWSRVSFSAASTVSARVSAFSALVTTAWNSRSVCRKPRMSHHHDNANIVMTPSPWKIAGGMASTTSTVHPHGFDGVGPGSGALVPPDACHGQNFDGNATL